MLLDWNDCLELLLVERQFEFHEQSFGLGDLYVKFAKISDPHLYGRRPES